MQSSRLVRDISSGAIGSGAATTIASALPRRCFLFIQNIGTVNIWVSLVGTAVAGAAGSFLIKPDNSLTFEGPIVPQNAISVIAASSSNNKITAYEA